MKHAPGFSIMEALVGVALAGMALAGLASVAGMATHGLVLARDATVATALAQERLESLRAGVRADGTDVVTTSGVTFTRRWSGARARGLPAPLSVDVGWTTHRFALATEALP
jgi:type II secretory pathway pseudopilin PulG